MIAPAPLVARAPSPAASSKSWVLYCGYVLLTTLSSWYYLFLVRPSLANDLLWPGFSTTGSQTFLGDVFQRLLQQSNATSSSLFAPTWSGRKSYDSAPTFIDTTLSLSRVVLQSPLTLETALPVLRATRFDWMLRMYSQYCYVDLDRMYAVSTTSARQERCDTKYKSNAAVYWEPLWRNAVPRDVLEGAYAEALDVAVFAALKNNTWWQSLWVRPLLAPMDEVRLWRSRGLTYWQTQVNNYYEVGLTENIEVVNALGVVQVMTIHQVPRHFRGLALWTMGNSYNGIWNDLWQCQAINCSLVRGASAASDDVKLHWETIEYGLTNDTPLQWAIRSHMGPFGSIDITLLAKPPPLIACMAQYTTTWYGPIALNASLATSLAAWPRRRVALLPTSWRAPGLSYFGGNPMCLGNTPQPFAQDQLGFYDTCTAPTPLEMVLDADAVLFAYVMCGPTVDVDAICGHCDGDASRATCQAVLRTVASWLATSGLPPVFANTAATDDAMQRLNLTLVQFAWNGSDVSFLTQPWVHGSWHFFGYLAVYDWMRGDREAYAYDSDNGAFALLSPAVSPTPLAANPLELPQHVSLYVWYVLLYSTSVLSGLALWVLLAASRSKLPRQLLHINRVAGLVWIGRPILLLRSATALAILSTSPMQFETRAGVSRFVFAPRSVLETMVLSGEATWATYVLVDVLLPLTKRAAPMYAPLSSLVAWLLVVLWDVFAPFQATLHVAQTCSILELGLSATCTGGRIEVGSAARFYGLLTANLLSVLLPALWMYNANIDEHRTEPGPLVAASVDAFFHSAAGHLDPAGAIMSGLLPLRRGFVDMSLWLRVGLRVGPRLQTKITTRPLPPVAPRRLVLKASAGFLYVVFSVVGSYSYVYVSETALANDLWWAGFNATGHQTLLANWFLQQLQVTTSLYDIDLTARRYRDNANRYNLSDTNTVVSNLYASMLQSEVSTLPAIVRGLRRMESGDVPWIATSYCFLDLNRSWSMAISSARQAQCNASNGAVYLEPILRNVAFSHAWWYPGFAIGIEAHLLTSASGRAWLATLAAPRLDIDGEVAHWRTHGLQRYETQWQNYKRLGVVESFSIATALNTRYAISLRASNASLHSAMQTSFKMQWPLASYFWAVTANASGMGGSSLLRESPFFAFGNATTIASVLARNQTLRMPLDPAMAALEAAVGPFGTIEMRRVAFPIVLRTWYAELRAAIVAGLAGGEATAAFAQISPSVTLFPTPTEWAMLASVGGDLTCPGQGAPVTFVLQFFSNTGACSSNNQDSVVIDAIGATQSLVSTNALSATVACGHMWGSSAACESLLASTQQLLQALLLPNHEALIAAVRDDDTLQQLRLVQYMQAANGSIQLMQSPLFPLTDPSFHVFGYMYLLEWLRGVREVVSFESNYGRVVTLSARNPVLVGPVNALEVPTNVATYTRYVLLYVTGVLMLVALLTGGHVLWSRGCVHGYNLFAINRVTGLVWIGRPLLLLRGVSALCLLSTARLDIRKDDSGFYLFHATQPSWPATIMAGGEATWVVFLLNDVASLYTREYTPLYAGRSSLAVWASVALWSLLTPVTPTAAIDRRCDIPAVDAQLVCESGVVAIGSATRLLALLGATNGIVLGTFLLQRVRCRQVPPPSIHSHLLYASAHYHFNSTHWLEDDVYYLDSASATIAGLLSLRWRHSLYVLDIKKWRLHVLAPPSCTDHRARALPLPLAAT
ncbi:hypothetical protein SPRG_00796 [Saprolegnia parasitica CBS 223.65]|uniref:Uncharacterized protein n=1 Tax=Saprolegnia parasitica (strain CBS 223.65) TaxID=695850 RepID=A0A067CVN1_SAPPC|nr:hypothetical protein SPRG_00796 [Saprolegnia parasitica CBS 223.65]KDO34734.1 hypothetical protein SPRG_00796 [Saprolegnia parasitica CBS 223.65]|eukprot:XP_012194403.1 hypothetical protein SPRG_00796 [Saprolegnia parasitica CBS 223.65]